MWNLRILTLFLQPSHGGQSLKDGLKQIMRHGPRAKQQKVKNLIRDSGRKHVIPWNKDTSPALPWRQIQGAGVALLNSVDRQ